MEISTGKDKYRKPYDNDLEKKKKSDSDSNAEIESDIDNHKQI